MNNQWQTKSSKELNLSFDFYIKNHFDRILEIEIKGVLRDLNFSDSYFDWFIEDLLFLLDQNRYQKRWDYGEIRIFGLKNLNLSQENLDKVKKIFKSVTNFDLIAMEE
ncbi:hypothetical protein [Mycoplasma procyoni]|uniref:hypothetical protein n=1 Tax=Mycoplasma procyoni TaxID=568784 RepID=UPI00197CB16B|nr:hypothetical protein [Mycoplasma procyoni]MBN3534826.1 hypothetical protein [Mycoplasma procyoni]